MLMFSAGDDWSSYAANAATSWPCAEWKSRCDGTPKAAPRERRNGIGRNVRESPRGILRDGVGVRRRVARAAGGVMT